MDLITELYGVEVARGMRGERPRMLYRLRTSRRVEMLAAALEPVEKSPPPRLTLRPASSGKQKVLDYLKDNPAMAQASIRMLANRAGVSKSTVWAALMGLPERKAVSPYGRRGGKRQLYPKLPFYVSE
jgi:hypothetical protein